MKEEWKAKIFHYYRVYDKEENELVEYCVLPESREDNEYLHFVEITEMEYRDIINRTPGWFVPMKIGG